MHITTGPKNTPRRGHHIDTATLPNPHDIPKLRPRNGTDPTTRSWILDQPETQHLLRTEMEHILTHQPQHITITCNAGWHRSITIGEELTRRLHAHGHNPTIQHLGIEHHDKKPTKQKRPTNPTNPTERGLGWEHQQQRRRLLAKLKDGTPCWWCGQPLHKKPENNFDNAPLEADHTLSRRDHGTKHLADRLLHRQCNRQRGAGDNDHQRPALNKQPNNPTTTPTTHFTW